MAIECHSYMASIYQNLVLENCLVTTLRDYPNSKNAVVVILYSVAFLELHSMRM